jgi:hypothetical protein
MKEPPSHARGSERLFDIFANVTPIPTGFITTLHPDFLLK